MPFKRRRTFRRRYGRRSIRRRRFPRRTRFSMRRRKSTPRAAGYNTISGPLSLFPERLFCKLQTATFAKLGDAVTSVDHDTISANSIYQPFGSSSTQPYGYDRFVNLYEKYLVRGTKVELLIENQSGANGRIVVGILQSDSTSSPYGVGATYREIVENPKIKHVSLQDFYSGGTKYPTRRLTYYRSTAKAYGLKRNGLDALELRSNLNANPSYTNNFYVYVASMDGTILASGSVVIQMKLTQYVEFTRPLNHSET